MTTVSFSNISNVTLEAGRVVVVTNAGEVYTMGRGEIVSMMNDYVFEVDEINDRLINGERWDA